jgi:hypothetical protein
MTNEQNIVNFLIDNPRSRLPQICVGTGLTVPVAASILDSFTSRGIIKMFYGAGASGTEYYVPDGKQVKDSAAADAAQRIIDRH